MQANPSDSLAWKSILANRNIVELGACKRIGNGRSLNIWRDPWVPLLIGFKPHPKDSLQCHRDLTVADLVADDGNWDITKLNVVFNLESVEAILKIPVPSTESVTGWF
ncbi:hypothetical protein PanWU01x14_099810 [Parasponia andersonii]|uniref:Uncharacterized protein n=1 Tax=Parasponia andersonii TaxID=3476 RepID=A0A2P5D3F8_PARAD|nr:hypothetical protein PanWU01x14_099810 [Parasponia andersonii]